jgi:hypothetical protein
MEDEEVLGPTVDDTVVAEVEADPIEPNNPIADLLSSIEAGEYNAAETQFSDLLGDRLQDALDQRKAEVAARIYGDEEVLEVEDELENEDQLELELDDDPDDDDEDLVAPV